MLLKGNANPGILDFQDAVIGPMVYDMASLLRDAYRKWPEVRQQEWLYAYWQKARAAGLPAPKNFAVFWRQYHIISAQRGLKVLGIFARLALRDGKRAYLKNMPLVHRHLLDACQSVNELKSLGQLLSSLPPL